MNLVGSRSTRLRAMAATSGLLVLGLLTTDASQAWGHDVRLPLRDIQVGTSRIRRTIQYLRASPALPPPPQTPAEHRKLLGAAEIELALENNERALQMLVARIADPSFHGLPEYVDTLLLASQLLEDADDDVGAMTYSRLAVSKGGNPKQMAEAGARWFRLARRHQRLDGRIQVYEKWRRNGGAGAAGSKLANSAAYEAAYALRAAGRRDEARRLLATIPSSDPFGSRATYLAGVLFVEDGDLANAERWFSAVKDWPLPDISEEHPQFRIEKEIRELSALSAARLLYERGDLPQAAKVYTSIPSGSIYQADACYELAFLNLERKRRRGTLRNLRCVEDLGVTGERYVDIALIRASMHAHIGDYDASVAAYKKLKMKFDREASIVRRTVDAIERPAEFLFDAMERSAMSQGRGATPGPAIFFADAWTPDLDRAYRIHHNLDEAAKALDDIHEAIAELEVHVSKEHAFPALEIRRRHFKVLLRDVQHLQGHAADITMGLRHEHASAAPPLHAAAKDDHSRDLALSKRLESDLSVYARILEAELARVDHEERTRITQARGTVVAMNQEIAQLKARTEKLKQASLRASDGAARVALARIVSRLQRGALRAEVGVLDTFWVRKEHLSKQIRELGQQKDELNKLFTQAEAELASELD